MTKLHYNKLRDRKNKGLMSVVDQFFDAHRDIELVDLCTEDGFSLYSLSSDKLSAEQDKVAAISSSLSSLSSAAAKHITNGKFQATIIEADTGNMLFLRIKYLDLFCSLSVSANHNISLGQVRFLTNRLAKSISGLKEAV